MWEAVIAKNYLNEEEIFADYNDYEIKRDYKKQIREELLDDAVAEIIVKLVSNPMFAAMMQEKINRKVDTTAIDGELVNYEKQLRQFYSIESKLTEEIDSLVQTTDIISNGKLTLLTGSIECMIR